MMPGAKYWTLRTRVEDEYPRFSVKVRSTSWLGLIFKVLTEVTGADYSHFTTTIWSTMYVPDDFERWTDHAKYAILRHEKQHVAQFYKWPLGRWAWPVNHVLTSLAYLLCFPVFLTMRAHFERDGYTQTLLVAHEVGALEAHQDRYVADMVENFGSSRYLWMWRRKAAEKWARETIKAIIEGRLKSDPRDVVP